MAVVQVRKDEPIDRALKRLTKMVTKEGILQTVKQLRFYEKPSEQKRKAKTRAVKRKIREKLFE